MPLHILSPQSTILPNVTTAFSVLATAAGVVALTRPRMSIEAFGLKEVRDEDGMKLAEALVQVYGIRNLSTGITHIALWYFGQKSLGLSQVAWRRVLGLLFVMYVATPLVDGLAAEKQGKTTGWTHWRFVPLTFGIGAALLMTPDVL